ncbi:hypothetical protein RUM43_001032 [Polyplax serrata]|uniref:Uncharacterized protein n=1 Tax=Polyplax serrata TaxID=468196 RepID=A0AAN8SEA3_POLSC
MAIECNSEIPMNVRIAYDLMQHTQGYWEVRQTCLSTLFRRLTQVEKYPKDNEPFIRTHHPVEYK